MYPSRSGMTVPPIRSRAARTLLAEHREGRREVRLLGVGYRAAMKRRGPVGLLSAALTLGAMPAGAASSVDLEEVAGELRSNPVYVDPDAERALTEDEVEELRSAIRGADTPIYIAVLPATAADLAGGDPAEVASQLAEAVDRDGTYGVVVGDSFRAGSSELPAGQAAELATDALDANGDDTAAVLTDFVDRVADAAVSGDGATGSGGGDGGDDGGTNWVLPVLLAGAAAVGGVLLWRRSRRRQEEAAERARAEAADRQLLRGRAVGARRRRRPTRARGPAASRGTRRLRLRRQPLSGCAGRARCRATRPSTWSGWPGSSPRGAT